MTTREKALLLYAVAATCSLLVTYAAGCIVAKKAVEHWPEHD